MKINTTIRRTDKNWQNHKIINKFLVKKIVSAILNKFNNLKRVKEFELSILLTNNMKMLDLNSKFLNNSKVTNVLSFPDRELDWRHLLEFIPDSHYMYLGDIAFGYEIIQHEATNYNKLFEHHFTHLLIHSILHLIGFDHTNDEEANIMESLEIEILKEFAISSPY